MRKQLSAVSFALLAAAWPAASQGKQGTLALVNTTSGGGGFEVAERAAEALKSYVGGWARQPPIAAYLAGRPNPGPLPAGDVGRELTSLVERLRLRQAQGRDLSDLGRLLGVDYLLLLHLKPSGYAARLFSIHRQAYSPQGLEAKGHDMGLLREYLREQTRIPKEAPKKRSWARYWIWGAAAVLGAVTLGLALSAKDDTKGDLRIRVTR